MSGVKRPADKEWDEDYKKAARGEFDEEEEEEKDKIDVEEKNGEQNVRVFSEMRGKNLYIDPKKSKK